MIFEGDLRKQVGFSPSVECDQVYEERQVYGEPGLPAIIDISAKKKKTEEDKILLEKQKNPPNSPLEKDFDKKPSQEEVVEPVTTSIIVGDKSVEIPSATLAMGANPIRKTVEDEQV